jgi:hypothetical protein
LTTFSAGILPRHRSVKTAIFTIHHVDPRTQKAIAVGPYEIAISCKPPENRFPPIITYTQTSTGYSIEIYLPFPFVQLPEEIREMVYRELFRDSRVTAAISYDYKASRGRLHKS